MKEADSKNNLKTILTTGIFVGIFTLAITFPLSVFSQSNQQLPGSLFCSKLQDTISKINGGFSSSQQKLQESREQAADKITSNRTTRDSQVAQNRTKEDQTRQSLYAKLESQAVTDAQKQAVATFKNIVEQAIQTRRAASDAAVQAFRTGLDQAGATRISNTDAAITEYKALVDAAIAAAQTGCTSGLGPATVRQNFLNSLKSAQETFRAKLKEIEDKFNTTAKSLKETEQKAVQQAHDNFKTTLTQAIEELKKAFREIVVPTNVPSEFQQLYAKLEGKLNAFNAKLDKEWNGKKHPVSFSAGLITANPNYGDTLLTPQIWDMTVKYLDKLQGLGVKSITVELNFPLLDPNFRGGEKYQQYLDFYKKLRAEISKRGLGLNIEVQPIFPDYSTLPVKPYYQSMTFDTYNQRVAAMLVTVAKELKPDYLTVSNEPDTAAANTGFPINNVDNAVQMVNFYVDELKKFGTAGIKYGAGFGTWQKDYQTWTKKYTEQTKLDFINIHIYAIDADLLDRALTISDAAKKKGKSVAIHESWLEKWQVGDQPAGDPGAFKEIMTRSAYSFWQPLDQKFLEALVKLAHYKKYEYISPFWSQYFFGYLDYETAKNLSASERLAKAIMEGINAALAGKITETGQKYKDLIGGILSSKKSCDVNHPCSKGETCYKFEDEEKPICWIGNPCEKCKSKKCVLLESYPARVDCH